MVFEGEGLFFQVGVVFGRGCFNGEKGCLLEEGFFLEKGFFGG